MFKWFKIVLGAARSALRNQRDLALENLVLRQQLAVLKQSSRRPQLTDADRSFWALISRIWQAGDQRCTLCSRRRLFDGTDKDFATTGDGRAADVGGPGSIPRSLSSYAGCAELTHDGALHGELLKLGIEVSETTVAKYMIKPSERPSQSWRTFLKNHAHDLVALDFFTVPTATFNFLFVLVILRHDRRRILHFNVTAHPTAAWTARQLLEACGFDESRRYLLRDRDAIYGDAFHRQARALQIEQVLTAPRSPWQNPYAERVIGSFRRECVNHIIVLGESHLWRILKRYVNYYNNMRTHLSLSKDAPETRPIQSTDQGQIVQIPRVGGLHHEYVRMAA